jgi:endonuclease-3
MAKAPYAGPLPDRDVAALFDALAERITPRCELEFASHYQLLVAVVLSAHTTDRSVNAATKRLFPVAPTPQAMVQLGVEKLKPFIRPVGLFNTKAANVVELSRLLIERHGGEVPADREALEALPGVGRKTANVVLNIAFRQPTVAVDTHIHRVANRTGIARAKTPEQTEQCLLARTPAKHLLDAHHYLILHGRYTCVARKPKCPACPVRAWCRFKEKTPAGPETPVADQLE